MKINGENWEESMKQPEKGTKCKVLILKEMVYLGKDENGHHKWQEDKQGIHQIFAWQAEENK